MHQARLGIHTDVSLHAKLPLIALLAGVHLRVSCLVLILRWGRCGNQGGIDGSAHFEQQAALCQELIDSLQDVLFLQLARLTPWGKVACFMACIFSAGADIKHTDGGVLQSIPRNNLIIQLFLVSLLLTHAP